MARLRFNIEGFGGGVLTVNADSVRVDAAGLSALRKLVHANTVSLTELCDADVVPRGLATYFARSSLPKPAVTSLDKFACRYDRDAIAAWCERRCLDFWG